MSLEAFGWSVIIVGAWNPAILTPDGVRRRLLKLSDTTPIEVQIPVDHPGPLRVLHDGVLVAPHSSNLEVTPERCEVDQLERAASIARAALDELPQTPVYAAGVNFKYKSASLPADLIDGLSTGIDERLSDSGLRLRASATKRSIEQNPGLLNLEIGRGTGLEGSIQFNFHRDSTVPAELSEWIGRVREFYSVTQSLMSVLRIPTAEVAK